MTAEPDFDFIMLNFKEVFNYFYIIVQRQKELSALQERDKTEAIKMIFIRVVISNLRLSFCKPVANKGRDKDLLFTLLQTCNHIV